MLPFDELSREELIRIIEIHAKNWLAHDGCWFLAAEEKLGMEAAIELDKKSWERFTVVEARRIMEAFEIQLQEDCRHWPRLLNIVYMRLLTSRI